VSGGGGELLGLRGGRGLGCPGLLCRWRKRWCTQQAHHLPTLLPAATVIAPLRRSALAWHTQLLC
jgi:hypothetical protein